MIADITIKISHEDAQRLLLNLEPQERFTLEHIPESLVIYPSGNFDSKRIILEPVDMVKK